ncbi:hypothetical protein SY88_10215 [Clostridiales bacterium PH28_bin88]|nr:hypothetical protein SY88_10215 [Clostridiales bacterium PH28_bin88]
MRVRDAFAELKRAGLEPLLVAARRKIYEQDGVRGKVAVRLGKTEREELANLLGRPAHSAEGIHVDLRELDAALGRSRFRTGLIDVLEAGYGPMVTRRQEREHADARWQAWLAGLGRAIPVDPAVSAWFDALAAGTSPSGRWARRAYAVDPDRAARAVTAVGRALAALPALKERHELLAIFAAEITGDPHAFDSGEPAGTLLDHALAERFEPPPAGLRRGEERALLLDQAGLGVDQVSSTVLAAYLATASVQGRFHPVIETMTEYGGGWPLTLGEVRRWSAVRARGHCAYVVENPPVFEYLLRRVAGEAPERRPTLICTGGFLSAAAVRLLDLLAAGGAELCYGGDFDRNGLVIASWLAARYQGRFRAWRLGPDDYRQAVTAGGKKLPAEDKEFLNGMEGPLADTARVVAQDGLTAYQERLVGMLTADILLARS